MEQTSSAIFFFRIPGSWCRISIAAWIRNLCILILKSHFLKAVPAAEKLPVLPNVTKPLPIHCSPGLMYISRHLAADSLSFACRPDTDLYPSFAVPAKPNSGIFLRGLPVLINRAVASIYKCFTDNSKRPYSFQASTGYTIKSYNPGGFEELAG